MRPLTLDDAKRGRAQLTCPDCGTYPLLVVVTTSYYSATLANPLAGKTIVKRAWTCEVCAFESAISGER